MIRIKSNDKYFLILTFVVGVALPFHNLSIYRNLTAPDVGLFLLLSILIINKFESILTYLKQINFMAPLILISIANFLIIIYCNEGAEYKADVIYGYLQVVLCLLILPLIITFVNLRCLLLGLFISSSILSILFIADRFQIFRIEWLVSYKGYYGYRPSLATLMQDQNATALFFSMLATLVYTCGETVIKHKSVRIFLFMLYMFSGLITLSRSYIIFVILFLVVKRKTFFKYDMLIGTGCGVLVLFALMLSYPPFAEIFFTFFDRLHELTINDGSLLERKGMYIEFIPEFINHYSIVGAGFSTETMFERYSAHSSIHNIFMDVASRGAVFSVFGLIFIAFYYLKAALKNSQVEVLILPYIVYFLFLPFLMTRVLWVGLAVAAHLIYFNKIAIMQRATARNQLVVHYANTIVGKRGNIGIRTAQILKKLSGYKLSTVCVCRGITTSYSNTKSYSMGIFGHIPRALNAYRIYVNRKYNHRLHDIFIFDFFSMIVTRLILNFESVRVAHVWDNCPKLIRNLKKRGIPVILDVPIAPLTYCSRLKSNGQALFLDSDERLLRNELECYNLADHILAPSAFVRDELALAGVSKDKISIVEFGVSNRYNNYVFEKNKNYHTDGVDFLFLGVVNQRKGIAELLEAWDCAEFVNDRLHLCGRVYPEIHQMLTLTQGGKIILPGFVNAESYITKCDVLVFPSWMEGSAKAILESMAHGIPGIVTTSSGSIIRDGVDGFIIKPGDSNSIRKKMLWFKANLSCIKSMGISAQARASKFTPDAYADKILEIYKKYT